MIEFVVCDDDSKIVENVANIIAKVMMQNKFEYHINKFYDYNTEFLNFVANNSCFCVYILDIETPSRSGIDIARLIREKDIDSVIIFLTGHEELGRIILKKELSFLTFINKFDESDVRIKKAIRESLRYLGRKSIFRFEEKGTIYTISIDDILYVTRDSVDRKSIIKTDQNEYRIHKSLAYIKSMLDDRFVMSHRACIVNKDRISKVNKSKKIIVFDNGLAIDLISDKYKQQLSKIK